MQQSDSEPDVASPCISVCRISPDTELCEGCMRTIDEVADWATMSNAERRAVLEAIEQRMQALFDKPRG